MARDKPVIWVKWKERYFCKQGWTRRLPNGLSGKSDIEENEAENASWKKAPARAMGAILVSRIRTSQSLRPPPERTSDSNGH
jgi:hypothetical protein